jgi:hypothetical protein
MFDFDSDVALPYSIFINGEILPANVRQEIAVRILHPQFESDDATRRNEFDFGGLLTLLTFEEGRRWSVRNGDVGWRLWSRGPRLL